MNAYRIRRIISKNKCCDKCGANNKDGFWIVNFTEYKAEFVCKKCGFEKEVSD